jgi:myosin-5
VPWIGAANEKLQQHFNTHIFKMELQEYASECIDVAQIVFVDNIDCLNLIESRPGLGVGSFQGILSMLDEELVIPKGSDASLITKMHAAFATKGKEHKHYGIVKKAPETFIIKHVSRSDTRLARTIECKQYPPF